MDSYHRKTGGPEFRRILIDIEHLYLGNLIGILVVTAWSRVFVYKGKALEDETPRRVIGLAKHLCGSATGTGGRVRSQSVGRL